MKRAATARASSLDTTLALYVSLLRDPDLTLATLAARSGIAPSTARRMVGALMHRGLLCRTGPGRYAGGLAVAPRNSVLAQVGRPLLARLARRLGATVHLGVLESDMVTYLVKEHGGGPHLRTRELNQLEAYCSAIGKTLLAALDAPDREAYLNAGAFVPMTPATITDPASLRAVIQSVRRDGYATDRAEFESGLYCLAVQIPGVAASISASGTTDHCEDRLWLGQIRDCASRIGARLGTAGRNQDQPPDDAARSSATSMIMSS